MRASPGKVKKRGPERQIFSPIRTKLLSRGGENKEEEKKKKRKKREM
jgi:hypothetical protein